MFSTETVHSALDKFCKTRRSCACTELAEAVYFLSSHAQLSYKITGAQADTFYSQGPPERVKLGSTLASIAREAGGMTDSEVEVIRKLRDKTPAKPMRFE